MEMVKLLTKEEEEVEVMQSWVEDGNIPAWPEEEAKGLLAEASLSPCPPILPSSLYSSIGTESSFYSLAFLSGLSVSLLFFQGLWSLQQASQLQEEAWKLEERAHHLETEGGRWGKQWQD